MADTLYHALVLNLHQPHGNLEHLLEHNEWEAREILFAMDRIPRSLGITRMSAGCIWRCPEPCWKPDQPDFQSRAYGDRRLRLAARAVAEHPVIDLLGTGTITRSCR
jgi:hypothetical protein